MRNDNAVGVVWIVTRESGDDALALRVLTALVLGRPRYGGWWARRAYLELRLGDVAAARKSMARAVKAYANPPKDVLEYHNEGDELAVQQIAELVERDGAGAEEDLKRFIDVLQKRWRSPNGPLP